MKKLITLSLSLILALVASMPTLAADSFFDVFRSQASYDAIEYVKAEGIVEGYPDGSFKPDNTINRVELLKIILESTEESENISNCDQNSYKFSDTPTNQWYSPYICFGKKSGLVAGYENGTFLPASEINFVEAAKIISVGFGQRASVSAVWYQDYVEYLATEKAIPTSINSFDKKITRGEMAEIIYRISGNVKNKSTQTYETLSGEVVTEAKISTKALSAAEMDYGYGPGLIPLGPDVSSSPKIGYVYSCTFDLGGGGAHATGEWINESGGYWDVTGKVAVDGDVAWPTANISIQLDGSSRNFVSNGLPTNHNTGTYPISSSDDAYNYDRNPNSISEQDIVLSLPANPTLASEPTCTDLGTIAMSLNGVAMFNAIDGKGQDAVAYEIQDECDGHPEKTGQYHYHSLSGCQEDDSANGEHSELVAYVVDGFGLYGVKGTDGQTLTNENLDVCHGHSHEIEWDGTTKSMYHYHTTYEYPYTIGCFMGTSMSTSSESTGSTDNTGPPSGGPPQAALDACSGKYQGTSCSFTDGNRSLSGSCISTPNGMACAP